MASIDGALLDLRRLDQLAAGETAVHRLDPRAKVLATAIFVITVVSVGRYDLSALMPFFLFPAVLMGAGDLPAAYLLKKVALVSPFALAVGIFNPLFDRAILLHIGPVAVSGGWCSCGSILLKTTLTVSTALVLVAVTGFPAIASALQRLGMPAPFAMQLVFLYRYLFVLTEEGGRAARAKEMRSFGNNGRGMAHYSQLVGSLLLRTWQRAERIHSAMLARGFTGAFRNCVASRFRAADYAFVAGWCGFFILIRLYNPAHFLGMLVTGAFR